VSYPSSKTFEWTANSTHSFRVPSPVTEYSGQTWRFNGWNESDLSTQKNITVTNDQTYTAVFSPAQPITIQTTVEGAIANGMQNYRPRSNLHIAT